MTQLPLPSSSSSPSSSPSELSSALSSATALVHTLGTLLPHPDQYKRAIKQGDIMSLSRSLFSNFGSPNPLENSTKTDAYTSLNTESGAYLTHMPDFHIFSSSEQIKPYASVMPTLTPPSLPRHYQDHSYISQQKTSTGLLFQHAT